MVLVIFILLLFAYSPASIVLGLVYFAEADTLPGEHTTRIKHQAMVDKIMERESVTGLISQRMK